MSDDSDDENNCRYGTPLEPYDEEHVPVKKRFYQDVSDQYALDANGKRRFHGAFTGGFTAGHGNSVAAPEGWTPSTFKSSRSDRAQKPEARKAEDFMDDEDRSEFGIAPRQVAPTGDFGGGKRKHQTQFHDGPIPGVPVLQVLLEPVHETAAMRILGSMGWRPGKGVGEQRTREGKKSTKKVYSCYVPKEFRRETSSDPEDKRDSTTDDQTSDEEQQYSEQLFEPDDLEPFSARPKTNSFGLGYSGLSRHSVLGGFHEGMSHLVTVDKGKKVSIRGQAFGVGAMEVEDEDIYAREDKSSYDFALDVLGKTGQQKKQGGSKTKPPAISHRTVLEGFVPAVNKPYSVKVYPPPALPRDFVPSIIRPSRFSSVEETSAPEIRDRGLGRHDLTAKHRGALLGEIPTLVPEEKVDKITEKHPNNSSNQTIEERIAAITGRNINFVSDPPQNDSKSSQSDSKSNQTIEERIAAITGRNVNFVSDSPKNDSKSSQIESKSSQKGLSFEETIANITGSKTNSQIESNTSEDKPGGVFKPFASNSEKQLRYEKYCAMVEEGLVVTSDSLHGGGEKTRLTDWEKVRELSEFERACKLYKPLTGLMNDRFVSATRPDTDIATLDRQSSSSYAAPDVMEAARVGMFGRLTREVTKWIPDPMLCRRFNVAEPYHEGRGNPSKDKKKLTYSIFEYLETPVHNKHSFLREHTGGASLEKRKETKQDLRKTPENETDPTKIPKEKFADDVEKKAERESLKVLEEPVKTKRLTVAELFLQEKEKERESLLNSKVPLEFNKEVRKDKSFEPEEVKETIDNFNKIDLYKAIFLSDSEPDDSEDDPKEKDAEIEEKTVTNAFDSPPRNVQRNESPPKGIFANLNFDKLNSWQNSSTRNNEDIIGSNREKSSTNSTTKGTEASSKIVAATGRKSRFEPIDDEKNRIEPIDSGKSRFESIDAGTSRLESIDSGSSRQEPMEADLYGPKLPEKHIFRPKQAKAAESQPKTDSVQVPDVLMVESSSSSDSDGGHWVEAAKTKSKKSKKEKKAKKSKKKKSEHKHKSKKKHKSKRD